MNTPLLHAVLLAATVMVSAGATSDTDVYKCSDAAGHVLLTDKPCGPGMTAMATASARSPPPGPGRAGRAPSPGALLRAKPLRRPLAIDIDTMKQAKLAMLNDDATWASQRAQRD